jgi:hypothetical protein
MDVSDARCVARAAVYYKELHIPRFLRSGTCKSKSRVYAAGTEDSVYISKGIEKRVVPRVYTVMVVHLLV